ncbi:MAG TPA: succinate dehydrogenase assembly factor 2 [Candidatus Azoamicus sp. OHIO2]
MKIKQKNISEIYLNCRRGMLELDLILLIFLEKHYNRLNNKLKVKFILLLNESDNLIYNLLIKNIYNKKYFQIINKIKKTTTLIKFS